MEYSRCYLESFLELSKPSVEDQDLVWGIVAILQLIAPFAVLLKTVGMQPVVRKLELFPHLCRLGAAKQDLQGQIHENQFSERECACIGTHRCCERAQWKMTCGTSLVSLTRSSSLSGKVVEGELWQFTMCPPMKSLSRTSTTR